MKAVLIPVKDLRRAKQRLAPTLSQQARTALALAMMHDVFAAVAGARAMDRVFVVSNYEPAIALARRHGWEVLLETEQTSESASVDDASRRCAALGVSALLRLPIDLPLLRSEDVDWLLNEAEASPSVVIVPSRTGGTNAILRTPPTLFPSHFGPASLGKHLAEAEARGARSKVLRNDRLEFDIDDPADLDALLAADLGRSATAQWLAAAGLTPTPLIPPRS
jgi:2-phospho-L-lactate guanylyltransferase